MGILAECPLCHKKQSTKNKKCSCGLKLDEAKKSKRVRYWITYRMPDGKQRRESVGAFEGLDAYSISDARKAEAKRVVQKKERRIFDMLPESKFTFQELSDWYLDLKSVKKLSAYDRYKSAMKAFNAVFGDKISGDINPENLWEYQEARIEQGLVPGTLDVELAIVKGMITRAFDNNKVGGPVLKAFRGVKNKLKRGANARKRTITIDEYLKLLTEAHKHLKGMMTVAMNTGMRPGEIKGLRWSYIDWKTEMITLPAEVVKERKEKKIPMNYHVAEVLDKQVRHIDHDFVFTHGGKPIVSAGGVRAALRGTCNRAGVPYGRKPPGIIMQDFRRTVKTNMVKAGIGKPFIDFILGHAQQGMDVHYIHLSFDDLKNAMEIYTKWLDEQIRCNLQNVDHFVDQAGISKS